MTRYAIDEALVRAAGDQPIDIEGIRVHIHNPYATEKVQLLNQVARANRARAVWNKPCGMVTVIGTPVDVDQVEMLFTSLLIQATRAMAEAGARRAGAFERSASFRRSFLMAYALRIGERLRETSEAAADSYGSALVPLLRRQEERGRRRSTSGSSRSTRTARPGSLQRRRLGGRSGRRRPGHLHRGPVERVRANRPRHARGVRLTVWVDDWQHAVLRHPVRDRRPGDLDAVVDARLGLVVRHLRPGAGPPDHPRRGPPRPEATWWPLADAWSTSRRPSAATPSTPGAGH